MNAMSKGIGDDMNIGVIGVRTSYIPNCIDEGQLPAFVFSRKTIDLPGL